MLTRLIDLCLNHRPLVLLCALLFAVFGAVSLSHLAWDAFPDTTPVQVQVNTNAPAWGPLEIERRITFPLEQALSGLTALKQVRSLSKFGFSQVTVVFEDGTDLYRARQLVAERVAAADLAPDHKPTLGPVATGLGEVFQYLVRSDRLTAEELRTLHHWVIRPQMVQVPGVAEINTWGGFEKQVHVVVDPARLTKYGLSLDDLARILGAGNRNAGGGTMDLAGESYLLQGRGQATGVADLTEMVVAQVNGSPVHLGDVADVRLGHEVRRGAVTAEGQGEVVLGLGFMLMGENSREVTQRLAQRLAEVQRQLPEDVTVTPVYQRTDLVDQVLATVMKNLLEGALLVIAVVFIFLGNFRAGLIVALAIPLSLLFAFNAMLQFSIVGSLMSLGAIDFGLVVDSSIIMVENAQRHLSEGAKRSVRDIVRDATVEVRKPTLFGELIICLVYLPVLTLEGVEGKLFRPMALTVIFALLGSMLFSMTLMPVLASYVLKPGRGLARPRLVLWLEKGYDTLLGTLIGPRRVVLLLACLAVVATGLLALRMGSEFVPRLQEQALVINTVRMAGISLDESVRYGTQIERLLLETYPDEIAHIWTRTGTAEVATDPMGLEVSDVFITLKDRASWRKAKTQSALSAEMSATLYGLPGMRAIFTQPIEMRVNEMIAGMKADLAIKLFGDDFEVLKREAERIRQRLVAVPGCGDVTVEQLTGQPLLKLTVDREAAGRQGIPVEEVLAFIDSLGTRQVGRVFEEHRGIDLVLKWDDTLSQTPEDLGRMTFQSGTGAQIPLSALVKIELQEGPSTIQREWAQRRLLLQTNIRGRDMGSFAAEVREVLAEVRLPPGYSAAIGGQFENYERARKRLYLVVPLALLLVLVMLYLTYGRLTDVMRIFTGVPFGAVGGIWALWWMDLPFSISAGVGFIALSGVSVLGDMVMVSRVRQVVQQGLALEAAIREVARTRLRPILMTGLVAALGFVPMVLNTGVGAEIQRPLAVVVVGGMATATAATLFILPLLYLAFAPRGGPDLRGPGADDGASQTLIR